MNKKPSRPTTGLLIAILCCCPLAACVAAPKASKPDNSQAIALEHVKHARTEYRTGNFTEAANAYGKAIAAGAILPRTFYNAACSAALAERKEQAIDWLNIAITKGWRDVVHLQQDTDLHSLQADPRWKDILKRTRQAEQEFMSSLTHPDLRRELIEMKRIDQEVRIAAHNILIVDHAAPTEQKHAEHDHQHKLPAHGADQLHVDMNLTARLKQIVAKYGWPTNSMVGVEGALSAFLLAQHADADLEFQRRCLKLMQNAPEGEVSKADIAYLTDRVLVNSGQKQLYGTQFHLENGKRVPRPIADEANLDQRRKEARLITMDAYTKHMTADVHDH